MHDIAVLNNIFFALEAKFAFLPRALLAAILHKIVIRDDLRADKSFFKIGMNFTGRLGRRGVFLDCPSAVFGLADRKEGDQRQKFMPLSHQLIQPLLGQAHRF